MIKALAHVCFHVRDLKRAEEFYCGKLGFRHAFEYFNDKGQPFGVDLHIGGRQFLELFRSEVTPAAPAQGYRHLCLEVDDMPATVADLRAKGIEVTDPGPGTDGSIQAWLKDPDGNQLELHCYTPRSKQNAWVK
jgi:catechol 2,3-dioxygenase-like lactoylglutathione lyase family enzyme